MLKYLLIQLDDSSVAFCHYNNYAQNARLISYNTLQKALKWSMKENLTVQLLYPKYEIPLKYKELIATVDHVDIVPSSCEDSDLLRGADVVVLDSLNTTDIYSFTARHVYVIRSTVSQLYHELSYVDKMLRQVDRINIVITDIPNFNQSYETIYSQFLVNLSNVVVEEYIKGHNVQINVLTDRILLRSMNNCGAGVESITIAPDGNFYICPGFYLDKEDNLGNLDTGLHIKNQYLYGLASAPICRICDAWQCKRCIWFNSQLTREVNTPGREQCVMSHIEREATRNLLSTIRQYGDYAPGVIISEIDYKDPFDKIKN